MLLLNVDLKKPHYEYSVAKQNGVETIHEVNGF